VAHHDACGGAVHSINSGCEVSLNKADWWGEGFYDDGEWVSWSEINKQIQYKEWRAKYPNADLSLVPYFEDLLTLAEDYYRDTGRHLNAYGDIGELFGAITYRSLEVAQFLELVPFRYPPEFLADTLGRKLAVLRQFRLFSRRPFGEVDCQVETASKRCGLWIGIPRIPPPGF
jgi:hypothetical protein